MQPKHKKTRLPHPKLVRENDRERYPELFDGSLDCYMPEGEPFPEPDNERSELFALSSPKPAKSVKVEFTADEVKLSHILSHDVPDVVSAVGTNLIMHASGLFRGYQRIDNRKTVYVDICEPAYALMTKHHDAFIDSVFGKSFLDTYEIRNITVSPVCLEVPEVYTYDEKITPWVPEVEAQKEEKFFPGRRVDIAIELDWDDPYVYRAETGEKGHFEELDMRDVLMETIFNCLSRAKDGVKPAKPVVAFEDNFIQIQDTISYASYWDFLNDYENTANTVFGEDFRKVYGISSLSITATQPVFSSPRTEVDYSPVSFAGSDEDNIFADDEIQN